MSRSTAHTLRLGIDRSRLSIVCHHWPACTASASAAWVLRCAKCSATAFSHSTRATSTSGSSSAMSRRACESRATCKRPVTILVELGMKPGSSAYSQRTHARTGQTLSPSIRPAMIIARDESSATISPSITVSSRMAERAFKIAGYRALKSLSFRERRWILPPDLKRSNGSHQLGLILDVCALRKPVSAEQEHRIDEACLGRRCCDGSEISVARGS
jgi:hypothetical protein